MLIPYDKGSQPPVEGPPPTDASWFTVLIIVPAPHFLFLF